MLCFVAMHESSKRLSQTLKDVYEPEWNGGEDLADIIQVRLSVHRENAHGQLDP